MPCMVTSTDAPSGGTLLLMHKLMLWENECCRVWENTLSYWGEGREGQREKKREKEHLEFRTSWDNRFSELPLARPPNQPAVQKPAFLVNSEHCHLSGGGGGGGGVDASRKKPTEVVWKHVEKEMQSSRSSDAYLTVIAIAIEISISTFGVQNFLRQ